MKLTRAELKAQARGQMSGKFGMLFLCFAVVWGIEFICKKGFGFATMPSIFDIYKGMLDPLTSLSPDAIDGIVEDEMTSLVTYSNLANAVSLAYWFLVYPMISVGLTQVLLNLTYGDVPQVGTIFEPYKTKFGKSIGTVWLKKLFEVLWIIPFCIVWIICAGVMIAGIASDDSRIEAIMDTIRSALNLGHDFGDALISVVGMLLWFLFIFAVIGAVMVIPYYIIISKYAMSLFVMNENPALSSTQCINKSKEMMQGHIWEFFVLKLSFFPWFLLCCIPFVGWISLAYTIPYMQVTVTNYYHSIKPASVINEFQYADASDITEVVETVADNILGEGFE